MHRASAFCRSLAGLAVGLALAWQPGALAVTPAPSTPLEGVSIPVTGVGFTDDGTIAGNAKQRAVLLRAGSVHFLAVGEEGEPSEVLAVSRSGNVAGTTGHRGSERGFVRMRNGALHALPAGFVPVGVNDAGQVVGHLFGEGERRSAVWRAGEPLAVIPDTDEMPFVVAGINDRGEVVASHPGAGVWSRGGIRRLPGTLPAEEISWASSVGINNRGEILANGHGYQQGTRPFIWSGGAARALPNPDPTGRDQTATATAMNDHGEVVGWFTTLDEDSGVPERFAVLWGREGVRLLGGIPGTRSCAPSAIDDAGTVLGVCEFRPPWRVGEGSFAAQVPVVWENGVARLLCGGGAPPRGREHPCDPASYVAEPPPAVLTARIHPGLPPYRFEFEVAHGVPVSVTAAPRDGSREPQRFEIGEGASTGTPIQLQDLDFDGYQDLAVITMGGVHNESFDYYLFDPATSAFVFFRADNLLVPYRERRELMQPIHDSCCAGELRTFRWVGKKLVLVRNEVWEPWSRDQTRTLRVVSERRNKRMVEVSRRVEAPKPDSR